LQPIVAASPRSALCSNAFYINVKLRIIFWLQYSRKGIFPKHKLTQHLFHHLERTEVMLVTEYVSLSWNICFKKMKLLMMHTYTSLEEKNLFSERVKSMI